MVGMERAASLWHGIPLSSSAGRVVLARARLDTAFYRPVGMGYPMGFNQSAVYAHALGRQKATGEDASSSSCGTSWLDLVFVFSGEECLNALTDAAMASDLVNDTLVATCPNYMDVAEEQVSLRLNAAGCAMAPLGHFEEMDDQGGEGGGALVQLLPRDDDNHQVGVGCQYLHH